MVHAPDGVERTAACLNALAETLGDDAPCDVVVVDDATTDLTSALLACLEGDVTVVRVEQPSGFAACANLGAGLACSDVLVFLPHRAPLPKDRLETLFALLARRGVGAVCGRPGEEGPDAPDWLAVCAEAFADAGGFDLSSSTGAAVRRLCQQIAAAGWEVVGGPAEAASDGHGPIAAGLPGRRADALDANESVLQRLEQAVEDANEAGAVELALATAAAAGEVAWFHHPGRFASPRIERALELLGRRLAPGRPRPNVRRPAERVLHVLTEAYDIGGHTRLAWRWMAVDSLRHHEVVLTAHRGGPPPPGLVAAAAAVHDLDAAAGPSPLSKAQALRELAARADIVVCHTHPFDAVAPAALAAGRPPVAFVNHAGHVFWLGLAIADTLVCLRESTARLAVERRGIDPARISLLPIPLDDVAAPCDRAEAKRRLGLDPSSVVLLTVASSYKLAGVDGEGFCDLVVPALMGLPNAVLVVVGPDAHGPWARASVATGGRLRAVGRQSDLRLFYAAADIYCDSYPLCSTTAFLEAALTGVPVLSYQPHGTEAGPLAADALGLDEGLVVARSRAGYRAALADLVLDETRRSILGERARQEALAVHCGDAWVARLETLYETAHRLWSTSPASSRALAAAERSDGWLDRTVQALHQLGGCPSIDDIAARHLAPLVPVG